MTRGSTQPQSGPLTTPSTSAATAPASSSAPPTSGSVRLPGARLSTRARRVRTIAATPIGTFTKNAARQPAASTSTPPADGPRPAARAALAAHSATACVRSPTGNACMTSASEAGTMIAAPIAWTIRAATSSSALGASAQAADAAVNTSSPSSEIRFRPSRSAARPAATRNAAKTMLYALSTHERSSMPASGNERAMSGIAIVTIVASRNAMKTPSDAINRTDRGATWRRRTTFPNALDRRPGSGPFGRDPSTRKSVRCVSPPRRSVESKRSGPARPQPVEGACRSLACRRSTNYGRTDTSAKQASWRKD